MGCHLIHSASSTLMNPRILASETFAAVETIFDIQVMLHDRFLYDRATGQWTVSRFLEDLKTRCFFVKVFFLISSYTALPVDMEESTVFCFGKAIQILGLMTKISLR